MEVTMNKNGVKLDKVKVKYNLEIEFILNGKCENCKEYFSIPLKVETTKEDGTIKIKYNCPNCGLELIENSKVYSTTTLLSEQDDFEKTNKQWEDNYKWLNGRQMFNGG